VGGVKGKEQEGGGRCRGVAVIVVLLSLRFSSMVSVERVRAVLWEGVAVECSDAHE
jgi:hypothetical protein